LAVDRSSTTDLAHNDVRRVLALAAREVPASFAINLLPLFSSAAVRVKCSHYDRGRSNRVINGNHRRRLTTMIPYCSCLSHADITTGKSLEKYEA